ncbi:hypothetical protein J2X73_003737 [Novosphingobium sp. 1748]|nr:hypothetical protein [Novosphingobium sp. 1748]
MLISLCRSFERRSVYPADLLAPLMLEIHIDVGRLTPLGADEAFEEQFGLHRVDGSNAQHEADRRIGGAAAPLTQNAPAARKPDVRVNGEEVKQA